MRLCSSKIGRMGILGVLSAMGIMFGALARGSYPRASTADADPQAKPGAPTAAGSDGKTLTVAGSTLWTKAHDIEIRGTLAYCAFQNGLRILDITDAQIPALLSQVYLGGGFAVDVKDQLAFVAAADKGLAVIDVSNPKAPVLKSILDTPGEARDVVVNGPYAYVADGPAGLLVVDIRNPAAPKVAGSWDSPGESLGLMLRGTTVFLADGSAGLQIVNVGNPDRPSLLGTLDTDGTAEGVALSGNYAYIADGAGGIKVMDVGATSAPKQTAALSASGYAHSVSADGKLLCVGSLYDGGYQILDISNPAFPAVLSTNKYTMYNESWRVVLRGTLGCIVDYFSGIFFMDFSDPAKPVPAGSFFTPSSIVAVGAQGHWAYAVGELSGLQVVDVADPARPLPVGATSIFRGVQNLTVDGRFAYVTDRWSLITFDVSDPAKPKPRHQLAVPAGVPRTIVIQDQLGLSHGGSFRSLYHRYHESRGAEDRRILQIGRVHIRAGGLGGLRVSGQQRYRASTSWTCRKPDAPVPAGVDQARR